MKIGVPNESLPGERRVAVTPETVAKLLKLGFAVQVEAGAGLEADAYHANKSLNARERALDAFRAGKTRALFATVIPVFAQAAAIRRLGAGQASLIAMVGPILTIGFGWWLLDESISVAQLGGAGLVVVGILIVSRR